MTGLHKRVLLAAVAAVVCLGAGCAVAGGGLGAALAVVGALTAWMFVGAGAGACDSVDGCLSYQRDDARARDDGEAHDDGEADDGTADESATDADGEAGSDGEAGDVDAEPDADSDGEAASDGGPDVATAGRDGPGPARGTPVRVAQQRLASAGVLSPEQLARLRRLQGRRG